MEEKKKRPAIPENVKRELWIKSGGRCEFRGCNKYLYKDGVTKQPRNLANIAHIVSWTQQDHAEIRILKNWLQISQI